MTDKHGLKQRRLYVWIPIKLFADIQYQANLSDQTLREFVIDALNEKLERNANEK